ATPREGRLLLVRYQYVRTRIYVDAFNLYYGALRNTPHKWLDIDALCRKLLSKSNSIEHIHYFTAPVSARPTDLAQPQRQQLYLRALRTIPHLSITNGRFLSRPVRMPAANPRPGQPKTVEVMKTEEKGSDVNLASTLLIEGFLDLYDVAVVVSNDSDLELPLTFVRTKLGKVVGLLNPHEHPSFQMKSCVSFYKRIRKGVLSASQFPPTMSDQHGAFSKPSDW